MDDRKAALMELTRRRFLKDPELYAREVLKVEWTDDQNKIAQSVVNHRRTFVVASHGVGKSMLMGGLVNWHFDIHRPGITLTTAPTEAQVIDVLWKETRRQRRGRPGLLPKAPRMETAEDHFAVGLTARNSDAFQGRHEKNVLIVFDEAVGVDSDFWDAAEGMMTTPERRLVAIMNPTDTSSRAYQEYCTGRWNLIHISALDHPNVLAALRGEDPPFAGAVQLDWVNEKVEAWCTPLGQSEHQAGDFEWPPGSGEWFRPGPLFESRVMGRWPSQATNAVWSQAAVEAMMKQQPVPQAPLFIGCDVARFGDDFTSIHVRRGRCSLHHESANGWDTSRIADRLKALCKQFAENGEDPLKVPCGIDGDGGYGGGVVDQKKQHNFFEVKGSETAREKDEYPNKRSEMWFVTAGLAMRGELDVSRLSEQVKHQLRTELMAPTYSFDSEGRRVVEKKEETKKRLKRSPDNADGFNICHYIRSGGFEVVWA